MSFSTHLTRLIGSHLAGYYYNGVDSDKVENLKHLKWKDFLTDPKHVRMEDAKVPLQVYP